MKKLHKSSKLLWLIGILILSLAMFVGCGAEEPATGEPDGVADTVLQSTAIYTVASEEPISGGIAIDANVILAVGPMEELEQYMDENTEVVDYGDQMIMPGFVDGHTHSSISEKIVGVDVTGIDDQAKATEIISAYLEENPDAEIVLGGNWYHAIWGGETADKSYLDAASTEIPIVLNDYNGHAMWVNSKALEMAGLDAAKAKEINDAAGTTYVVVDENGEPTGHLMEDGMDPVMAILPDFTAADLEKCINEWNQYGVTTVSTMSPNFAESDHYDMLEELESEGRLTVRQMISISSDETDENIQATKERFDSDMVRLTALKTFMDGVASDYTASMIDDYAGGVATVPPYITAEDVSAIVEKAYANGLGAHFHACGDNSLRTTLDGYDMAVANGVEITPVFSIEHYDVIHPDDMNRSAELGISCNVTPDFLDPTGSWDTNPYIKVLKPEQAAGLWNYGSLFKSGANVTFGTDSYYSSYSPFVQLYRATERVCNDGQPAGGYLPDEKFALKDAIKCYTLNAAKSVGMDDKIGTLEAGKYADIIVLDTNILTCSPEELFNAGVAVTYLNGNIIYTAE